MLFAVVRFTYVGRVIFSSLFLLICGCSYAKDVDCIDLKRYVCSESTSCADFHLSNLGSGLLESVYQKLTKEVREKISRRRAEKIQLNFLRAMNRFSDNSESLGANKVLECEEGGGAMFFVRQNNEAFVELNVQLFLKLYKKFFPNERSKITGPAIVTKQVSILKFENLIDLENNKAEFHKTCEIIFKDYYNSYFFEKNDKKNLLSSVISPSNSMYKSGVRLKTTSFIEKAVKVRTEHSGRGVKEKSLKNPIKNKVTSSAILTAYNSPERSRFSSVLMSSSLLSSLKKTFQNSPLSKIAKERNCIAVSKAISGKVIIRLI